MSEFEINEEMKTWAKDHFDNMGIGGVWSPEGTGLTYQNNRRQLEGDSYDQSSYSSGEPHEVCYNHDERWDKHGDG